jgi:hypothetical protein
LNGAARGIVIRLSILPDRNTAAPGVIPPEEISGAPMHFQTRPIFQVLDDRVAKLETMPQRHPDRPNLVRMIMDLRREIDRRPSPVAAGDC